MSIDRQKRDEAELRDVEPPGLPRPQRVAVSGGGMASTQHYLATDAAVQMLEAGGNAVDGAVAAAFALGVCEPAASGLGGQTMMLIHQVRKTLQQNSAAGLFLKGGSKSFRIGERFRQPALANTLRRLSNAGVADFYTGQIAKLIHEDMARNHGLITEEDLAQIPWPIERKPVSCQFEDFRVVTFPPPGAGRTLVEMLNIISHIPRKYRSVDTPEGALMLAQAIRQATAKADVKYGLRQTDRPLVSEKHQDTRRDDAPVGNGQVRKRRSVDPVYRAGLRGMCGHTGTWLSV